MIKSKFKIGDRVKYEEFEGVVVALDRADLKNTMHENTLYTLVIRFDKGYHGNDNCRCFLSDGRQYPGSLKPSVKKVKNG